MSWVAAVKEFNASRERWVLPRKGTPEYDEVKKIQDRMKESAPPKPAKAPAAEGAQKPPGVNSKRLMNQNARSVLLQSQRLKSRQSRQQNRPSLKQVKHVLLVNQQVINVQKRM
jgi:hypothetical protein